MAKDIHVPARIIGGKIPVKASLGQTVIVTEGPETYTGPTTVTPSESEQTLLTKDKLVADNVTVNPIPSEYVDAKADYEDALIAFGVESDLADGITALTEYSNSVTGEQDENLSDAVRSLADGYGSCKKQQGTFVGNNSNKIDIPCEFEPSVIFIYAENNAAEFSGLYLICIIKDRFAILGTDSNTGAVRRLQYISYGITGYNDPPVEEGGNTTRVAQASYSNGVLTVGAVSHPNQWYEFKSGVTFEYILVN